MGMLELRGGKFTECFVLDTGNEYRDVWCEKDGVKAQYALDGVSRCYTDVYLKKIDENGIVYYQYTETEG